MAKMKSNRAKQETASKEVSEATIRMNINISKAFHKKIKQKALDEDTTITEIVVKALKAYLKE